MLQDKKAGNGMVFQIQVLLSSTLSAFVKGGVGEQEGHYPLCLMRFMQEPDEGELAKNRMWAP